VSNPPDCADSRASLLLALTAQHGQAFPTAVSDRVSGVPRLSRSEPAALKSAVEHVGAYTNEQVIFSLRLRSRLYNQQGP
jgi:hypothetical protein